MCAACNSSSVVSAFAGAVADKQTIVVTLPSFDYATRSSVVLVLVLVVACCVWFCRRRSPLVSSRLVPTFELSKVVVTAINLVCGCDCQLVIINDVSTW